MFRKVLFVVCVITILSLLGSGLVYAKGKMPTWETVFDPGPYIPGDYHQVHAVEEFKGDLYAVAGDPVWFDWEVYRESAGQVFRSPDGKNWEPASELGFGLGAVEDGCGANYYDSSWDMIVFQDKLYLLPNEACYLRPGVVLRSSDGATWESVVTAEELGKSWDEIGYGQVYGQFFKLGVFEGMIYTNMDYFDPNTDFAATSIFRSPSGDPGTWEEVKILPGWVTPGAFHTFKGALYITSGLIYEYPDWNGLPGQIWRTFDGVNWELVVWDGFGDPGTESMGFGAFADYKGYLYIGIGTHELGGQIWRSKDGRKWKPVVLDGFGNPLDEKVDGLIVYRGQLYAYTVNWTEGASVYRTKNAKTWERVNEPGWGNPLYATTHLNAGQAVFKDELYMGVIGPQGVLLKMAHPDK